MLCVLQNGNVDDSERDVYEYMLTRDEVQKGVTDVNATVRAEIAEAKCKCPLCTLTTGVHCICSHKQSYCLLAKGDVNLSRILSKLLPGAIMLYIRSQACMVVDK